MVSFHRCLLVVASNVIIRAPSSPAFSGIRLFAGRFASPYPHPRRLGSSGNAIMDQRENRLGSSSNPPTPKRVVLVGGGHAHVQVIKSLNARSRPSHVHVTLIDLQPSASYSGMVPGCVAKLYTTDQVLIALDSLAAWAGIEFVRGRVVGMSFDESGEKKSVLVEETGEHGGIANREYPFDVVSIDIGSTTRDHGSIPGAEEHTISTRPISDLLSRIQKEEEMLKEKLKKEEYPNGAKVVVVGGGAAGIELSLALRSRWNDLLNSKLKITLIDSSDVLLPLESPACRAALNGVLEKYGIDVRQNLKVDEVTSTLIHVSTTDRNCGSAEKKEVQYTHCIWATGAEAHQLSWNLQKQCGLSLNPDRGWILVNEHLQSLSHPSVFAAGDCCEIVSENRRSPPKAGVYAVRSGPILIENLTRYVCANENTPQKKDKNVEMEKLVTYRPQDDFMKLLMCGDGTALGFRFGIPLYGKWVWQLKDRIDRMFMDLFDVANLPIIDREQDKGCEDSGYDTSQYDRYEATAERMDADDAGKLLLRTDNDVNYQNAWNVIREMMADEKYKEKVLEEVNKQLLDS